MKKGRLVTFLFVSGLSLFALTTVSFQSKIGIQSESGHFVSKNYKTSVTILTPKMNSKETGCNGGCITKLEFSDQKVPSIAIKDCIGGELTNLGDLDGDGLDEIGFLPGWFAGCWHNYRVFTFKNKRWKNAVPPFPTHCNEFEAAGVKPIIINPAKPGYVLVTYSSFDGDSIVFKTKSEPIK